jgi:CDP-paratose 2-epimerase
MKILITGICGFVGYRIASHWAAQDSGVTILGIDNLSRPGSESNRQSLKRLGIRLFHGDIRCASDFESLPAVDWVLDCAANPSVLAGIDGHSSSRQLMEHNLGGSIELLEYCRRYKAGFVLLSTSRVYGVEPLASLPMKPTGNRFALDVNACAIPGVSERGVSERFPTDPPLSLYGASKRAAEVLALEYGATFDFPVWINRCGVLAGPGQFGKADQGIISYWIHAHRSRRPLKYIGFGGNGLQVRDFLDPLDLIPILKKQFSEPGKQAPRTINLGGGEAISLSLRELTNWCDDRFGKHPVEESQEIRPFDIPWVIMDSSQAEMHWGWSPVNPREAILESIADHAVANPDWLTLAT